MIGSKCAMAVSKRMKLQSPSRAAVLRTATQQYVLLSGMGAMYARERLISRPFCRIALALWGGNCTAPTDPDHDFTTPGCCRRRLRGRRFHGNRKGEETQTDGGRGQERSQPNRQELVVIRAWGIVFVVFQAHAAILS